VKNIGQLSSNETERLLLHNIIGRIGCNDGVRNYVVPVNYIYDGHFIYGHSVEGMKTAMMRKNPSVCFQTDEVIDLDCWKSVIAWGTYSEIEDELEKQAVMNQFVSKALRLKVSKPVITPELSDNRMVSNRNKALKFILFRIEVLEKTGRYESP